MSRIRGRVALAPRIALNEGWSEGSLPSHSAQRRLYEARPPRTLFQPEFAAKIRRLNTLGNAPMRRRPFVLLLAGAVLAAGCAMPKMPKLPKFKVPRVHKITVQQGNVITQEMVDQLQPGMTREQVAFIMGEPVVRNIFNQDRWDYIYTIKVPGRFETEQRFTVFFENDVLSSLAGDLAPSDATAVAGSGG